jgi:hypothetical protein
MDESEWLPSEADEPTTDVRRHVIHGDQTHTILISVTDETANVRFEITEPSGISVGRLGGELPAATLSVAGDLVGKAMSAAGRAHGGTGQAKPRNADRLRARHRNHGARWTADDEERLTERFRAGAAVSELSDEFGRNINGIRARLVQLGLLPAEEWPARLGEPPANVDEASQAA